jgi:2-oxoglutarate ferredoxin oxidoreductase subunit beta
MVELLSTCNTNWGMTVQDSLTWLEEHMIPVYPIQDFKVSSGLNEFKA